MTPVSLHGKEYVCQRRKLMPTKIFSFSILRNNFSQNYENSYGSPLDPSNIGRINFLYAADIFTCLTFIFFCGIKKLKI